MILADREAFLEIVVGFAELKGKSLSAPALELYWNSMQHWSLAEFKTAANQLLRTCAFMPVPKDFEDLRKAGRETAGEIFAGLRQWLQYSPTGYTLQASTPRAIASALGAIGGPHAYAMARADQMQFLERRFCEHYDDISGAEETRQAVPQLAFGLNSLPRIGEIARLLGAEKSR